MARAFDPKDPKAAKRAADWAPVTSSFFVTTSKAPVTTSVALVTSSFLLPLRRSQSERVVFLDISLIVLVVRPWDSFHSLTQHHQPFTSAKQRQHLQVLWLRWGTDMGFLETGRFCFVTFV